MLNHWNVPGCSSVVEPPALAPGELPPEPPDPHLIPPAPLNPSSPLSPLNFPSLDPLSQTVSKSASKWSRFQPPLTVVAPAHQVNSTTAETSASVSDQEMPDSTTVDTVPQIGSENSTVKPYPTDTELATNPTPLPSKGTSPLCTNHVSSAGMIPLTHPSLPPPSPLLPNPTEPAAAACGSGTLPPKLPTLVEKIRAAEDKTLSRLAPVTISSTGRPRIPDEVFQKGADLHKDFIICYYNGKAPPFNQIQSVFNHMWGKGKQLEIHNNPLNRSTIVRIQSDYLREKILDKCVWYVGDTMFHTAQWSSEHSKATPPLKAIKIWAHLTGVPLDLRHKQGLSLVAGLVGHPKETDDFTRNLVSLTVSHVKVEVDLTQPLPDIVEFERQSEEVVEVSVHYPWVPPTCLHCHELGHIVRNCLTYTPPPKDKSPLAAKPASSSSSDPSPSLQTTPKPALNPKTTTQNPSSNPSAFKPLTPPQPQLETSFTVVGPSKSSSRWAKKKNQSLLKTQNHTSNPSTSSVALPPIPLAFSSPDPPPIPSLKRSRSSPTLFPPLSLKPNPFVHPPGPSSNPFSSLSDSSTFLSLPSVPSSVPVSPPNLLFGSIGSSSEDPSFISQ